LVTNKVAIGTTMLAKLIPLFLVIPLFFRLQTFDFLPSVDFDITQFTYLLALGVITVVSFIEFRIALGERPSPLGKIGGLNLGSAIALILVMIGLIFIFFVVFFDYQYDDPTINEWISWYMLFSILVLSVQAIRELVGARHVLKTA
jgi:hypothetical protein